MFAYMLSFVMPRIDWCVSALAHDMYSTKLKKTGQGRICDDSASYGIDALNGNVTIHAGRKGRKEIYSSLAANQAEWME